MKNYGLVLVLACLPCFGQTQQPSPVPPPADRKTVFQRAVDLYEAKKFPTALLAFQEAANAGVAEAYEYLGVMYSEGQGTPVELPGSDDLRNGFA